MAPKKSTAVVEVTILPGGILVEPEPFECHSNCKVLFVITNTDSVNTYYVGINTPDTIYMTDYDPGGPPAPSKDPFASPGKHFKQLKADEVDTIKLRILPNGNFGKTKALQYTT